MTTTEQPWNVVGPKLTDAELLKMLKNPEIAMGWAIEHLPDWDVKQFLRDWKDDADLTPWVEAARIDQKAGEGDWSGHPAAAK